MTSIENQLVLALALGRPNSMGNFVYLADDKYLEEKSDLDSKWLPPHPPQSNTAIKEHI